MNEPAYLRVDAADLARLINNHGEALRGIEMAKRADTQWSEEVDRLRTSYTSLRRALHEALGYDQADLPMADIEIVELVRDMAAVIRLASQPDGAPAAAVNRVRGALSAVPAPQRYATDKWKTMRLDVVEHGKLLPEWQPGNWAQVTVDNVTQKVMILRAESAGRYLVRHENGSEQVFTRFQLEPIVGPVPLLHDQYATRDAAGSHDPWAGRDETAFPVPDSGPVTGFTPNPEIIWAAPDETAFPESGDGGPPAEAMQPVTHDDLTDQVVSDLLLLVGRTIPPAVVATWSPDMREQAANWAGSVHLSASDNDDVVVPPEPEFIAAAKVSRRTEPAGWRCGACSHPNTAQSETCEVCNAGPEMATEARQQVATDG